jgi:hypothetical protein
VLYYLKMEASLKVDRKSFNLPKTEGIQKCIKAHSSVRLF